MSAQYTVQFTLNSGNDEFWDSYPSPKDVLEVLVEELKLPGLDIEDIRIVKVVDSNIYTPDDDDNET